MKNITLSLAILLLTATAHAQLAIAPELGLTLANMTIKTGGSYYQPPGTQVSTSAKPGLSAGVLAEVPLSAKLFIQPGFFYQMNGCRIEGAGTTNINTLQLPVSIAYKSGHEYDIRFVASAGFYIGYNISGTTRNGGVSAPIDIGSDSTHSLKPIDAGFGVNAGLDFGKVYMRIRYLGGLTNLQPGGDAFRNVKTSAIGIAFGYYFKAQPTHKDKKKW